MLSRIPLILILLAALPGMAHAQAEVKNTQEDTAPLFRKVDLDFPGGTIPQLLEAIETQNKVKPNVMISDTALDVHIPPFRLQAVDVGDIIMGLRHLGDVNNYQIDVTSTSPNLMTITVHKRRTTPPKQARVFDVKGLLKDFRKDGLSIDDIVTAIETSWSMQSPEPSAQLKYHKETNLLIAVGISTELDTVQMVLAELHGSMADTGDASKIEKEISKIRAEVVKLQDLCEKLQAELKALQGDGEQVKRR